MEDREIVLGSVFLGKFYSVFDWINRLMDGWTPLACKLEFLLTWSSWEAGMNEGNKGITRGFQVYCKSHPFLQSM